MMPTIWPVGRGRVPCSDALVASTPRFRSAGRGTRDLVRIPTRSALLMMGSAVVMPTVLVASSVSQATGGAVANYGWRAEADIVGSNVAAGWRSGRVRTTAISGSYAATIGWLQCHDLLSVKLS